MPRGYRARWWRRTLIASSVRRRGRGVHDRGVRRNTARAVVNKIHDHLVKVVEEAIVVAIANVKNREEQVDDIEGPKDAIGDEENEHNSPGEGGALIWFSGVPFMESFQKLLCILEVGSGFPLI
jgi:hypothetical protein